MNPGENFNEVSPDTPLPVEDTLQENFEPVAMVCGENAGAEEIGSLRTAILSQLQTSKGGVSNSFRTVLGASAIALAGLGFAGSATAGEKMQELPTATAQKTEASGVKKEGAVSAKQLEQEAKAYVAGLGTFAKLGMVNEIKEKATLIRAVIDTGNFDGDEAKALLASSGKNLKPLLATYLTGLEEMRKSKSTELATTTGNLKQMVTMIQTKSLGEIQKSFET